MDASHPTADSLLRPFGDGDWEGFLSPGELRDAAFECVPKARGLYQVLWRATGRPLFLEQNPAGRFKGKDPSENREALRERWLEGTNVLYLGTAGEGRSRSTLRSRLRSMVRFGRGEPVGHWDGRRVWQLVDPEQLSFCWKRLRADPAPEQRELLERFRAEHGAEPFAN